MDYLLETICSGSLEHDKQAGRNFPELGLSFAHNRGFTPSFVDIIPERVTKTHQEALHGKNHVKQIHVSHFS